MGGTEVCVLKTDLGTMVFEFFEADAPKTVAQFKALAGRGFYDGKDFYRVVRGHVIQAGGGEMYQSEMTQRLGMPAVPPICDEVAFRAVFQARFGRQAQVRKALSCLPMSVIHVDVPGHT
jgi:cyclophilin family peptidyl-prolyl cis-trans isomerase